jgi:diaminohydroxyphosphoribosylaminopyrimidine deaminase/5-amino-6-(5-phosphoribosylamino)uracil reductase
VLDETLSISAESQLVKTAPAGPVLVFVGNSLEASKSELMQSRGIEVIRDAADGRDLLLVLKELGRRSIQSVLVEGGSSLAGKLLDARLVNKVSFFIAPMIIGGREAPTAVSGTGAETLADALELQDVEITQRGRDVEVTGYPHIKDEG